MIVARPCPICGASVRVRILDSGISCPGCGLWFGSGSLAIDRWREMHDDENKRPEPGWIVEVWNGEVEK